MESEVITSYIGLGSNLGDRAGNLLLAVRGLMEASFVVNKLSAIYETDPQGVDGHPLYLNLVAEICVKNISPSQMLARMLRIEYLLGRKEKNLKTPRTVDIDLLLYGDFVMATEFLTIPHPRMHERRFVLKPLCELNPHLIIPTLETSVREILNELDDDHRVERWSPLANNHSVSI